MKSDGVNETTEGLEEETGQEEIREPPEGKS